MSKIHATGGDIRRICDLFGLAVDGSVRYAATLGHPTWRQPCLEFANSRPDVGLLTAYQARSSRR